MSDPLRDDPELLELLAHERGEPLPGGKPSVSLERSRRLATLLASLPAMPAEAASTSDWHQRTLAGMHAAMQRPASPVRSVQAVRRRPLAWAAVAFAAAAAIVFVVLRTRAPSQAGPLLAIEIQRSAEAHLATDTSVGDTLIVRGAQPVAGELRVYDEHGAMVAQCASVGADCAIASDDGVTTMTLRFVMRTPGELRVVMFSGPLAGPSQGLSRDVIAANHANITVTTREPVRVR